MSDPKPSAFEVDEIDYELIDHLLVDGLLTNRALAEHVGLTDATVATRIRRLVDKGVMNVIPQFDWEVAGFHSSAFAMVSVADRTPVQVGEEMADLPGALSVEVTYGSAGIVAMLLAVDDSELHRVATMINKIDGVRSVVIDQMVEVATFTRSFAILPYEPTPLDELPDPPFEFDELDAAIIDHLRADGRLSSREIARQTWVSDATVRSRRRRMEDAGLLRVRAVFDPWTSGRVGAGAHVGLQVVGNVETVVEKLVADPAVASCVTTLGAHPLVVTLGVPSEAELAHYLTESLWELDGVQSVDAWPIVQVVAHRSDLVRFA